MARTCILFADNDRDFLTTRSESLEQAGYTVIPASSVAQAQRKLEAGGIDLAILDIRLRDDDDEKDKSGLVLAKEVARSVPKIILTGFPSTSAACEALAQQATAVDFVDKGEGPSALVEALIRVSAKPGTMTSPNAAEGHMPRGGREWLLQLVASNAALLALLLAFGAGIVAIVTGDPGWLVGTILFAIVSVLSSGLRIRPQ